jgi:U4/U6.U5 tri-snRNP-associated protein 1
MADAESISLEETNRIRISLGLKPLQPPSQNEGPQVDEAGNVVITADEEERRAVENLKALRAEQAKSAEQEALRKRLQKNREKKALTEKLAGRTLAEPDDEQEEDLKSWIKRTKKRERELAAKKAEDLEDQDKLFQEEYTSSMSIYQLKLIIGNLEGLRVAHDIGDIEQGEGMILTLKDRGVLENDDDDDNNDELISTTLAEKERLKQNLENKIKKPKYDPYAEEYDSVTGEKKILSKYDEEEKRKVHSLLDLTYEQTFIIGEQPTETLTDQEPSRNLFEISLDYESTSYSHAPLTLEPLEITSDYADPSTFKIKKPKKRKNKSTTSASALLGDSILPPEPDMTEMDDVPGPSKTSFARMVHDDTSGTADDEELQEMLAQRRRQATKRRKLSRPEDFIQQYRLEEEHEMADIPEEGGLVLDDTSEFVRGIEMARTEEYKPSTQAMHVMDEDTTIEPADTEMVDAVDIVKEEPTDTVLATEVDNEPIIGNSLAATLAALKRRGELQTEGSKFKTEDLQKREEILIRQQRRKLEQEAEARRLKEMERENERFQRMSRRDREKMQEERNVDREKREAMQRMREFNEFKFNVDLEYKDEFGHEMTPKDVSLFS